MNETRVHWMHSAQKNRTGPIENTGYDHISDGTRTLANTLSSHLGLNKALEFCRDNQWHGVLAALEEIHSLTDGDS